MAISYDTVDFNGVEKEVITVDGAQAGVIFKDSLDLSFDAPILEKVIASAGADLTAKLAAYTMPNGQAANVYYTGFIKTLADYADLIAGDRGVNSVTEFTATSGQTDFEVSHNGKAIVFVEGTETEFDGTDRSKVVIDASTAGDRVSVVVLA